MYLKRVLFLINVNVFPTVEWLVSLVSQRCLTQLFNIAFGDLQKP